MPSYSQRPQSERLVVGIAGRIGSGKTTVGEYLASRHGFQYLRYSQVLSGWLAKGAAEKVQLQKVGWEVMAGGMQHELNQRLIAQMIPGADVAVDGLRHPLDYKVHRDSFLSSFHLLYINSTSNDRWERLKVNGRYESIELFETADAHPVEQEIELLRAHAEFVIENDGSLQHVYEKVDELILRFRKEGRT